MDNPEFADPLRAEVRAYLRAHPEGEPAGGHRHRPARPAARGADSGRSSPRPGPPPTATFQAFWTSLERDHPEAAAALTDTVLAPIIIEVAREERAPD